MAERPLYRWPRGGSMTWLTGNAGRILVAEFMQAASGGPAASYARPVAAIVALGSLMRR